jgi:hypothetical protein
VAQELVQADLNFKGFVFVFVIDVLVRGGDEGDGFFRGGGAEDVAEGDVFEAFALADVVVLWDVVSDGGESGFREENSRSGC